MVYYSTRDLFSLKSILLFRLLGSTRVVVVLVVVVLVVVLVVLLVVLE